MQYQAYNPIISFSTYIYLPSGGITILVKSDAPKLCSNTLYQCSLRFTKKPKYHCNSQL
ncbi:hypothetical protein FPSM_00086 [Flavobacterium psychrophilum]|nr:hypothetical protein FPSM_00086 [Flavobacterium psychrophilum]